MKESQRIFALPIDQVFGTEGERGDSPYGTIFATFSCRHRQKCSVSCNSYELHSVDASTVSRRRKPANGIHGRNATIFRNSPHDPSEHEESDSHAKLAESFFLLRVDSSFQSPHV